MIRRLRAWARRTRAHWQKKRELLLEADKLMRQWNYAPNSLEEIELYLLQIGLLHLQAASVNLYAIQKPEQAGLSPVFEPAGSHRVH